MIVWGSKGRLLNLGRLDERECANCGMMQPFQVSLAYKYFHVYGIFRLVTKKNYWLSCVVCEQGWELKADQIESAIGKPPIPVWDRFSLVFLVVLAVALVYVLVPTPAERDEAGTIVGGGEVDVFRIQLGDCFDDDRPISAEPGRVSETEVTGVEGVPCTAPHDNEVYATFDLDLVRFPRPGADRHPCAGGVSREIRSLRWARIRGLGAGCLVDISNQRVFCARKRQGSDLLRESHGGPKTYW